MKFLLFISFIVFSMCSFAQEEYVEDCSDKAINRLAEKIKDSIDHSSAKMVSDTIREEAAYYLIRNHSNCLNGKTMSEIQELFGKGSFRENTTKKYDFEWTYKLEYSMVLYNEKGERTTTIFASVLDFMFDENKKVINYGLLAF